MVGWHHQLDGHEFEQAHQELVMDREAWRDVFHEVTKTWTPLSSRTDSDDYYHFKTRESKS